MTDWLPDWLFEGQLTIYAVLAAALVFLFFVWKQTPRSAYLVGCAVLVALLGLYWLLDFLVETDREQITHSVQEISAGVEARDVNRILARVSDTYNRHGVDKAAFRQASARVIDNRHVDQVIVYSFQFQPGYKTRESASDQRANIARVSFMAKPVGPSGANLYLVEAVMHRDTDGVWRMQSWEVFQPFHDDPTPVVVPEMP